jgi:hypothetical protein
MPASSSLNNTIPGPDDLYSGNIRTMPVLVDAGAYVRGEVLGLVGNLYGKLSVENAVAAAVMPFDVTLAEDAEVAVYIEGDFNEDALVIGAATLADVKTELRQVGIMARKWGAAPNVA